MSFVSSATKKSTGQKTDQTQQCALPPAAAAVHSTALSTVHLNHVLGQLSSPIVKEKKLLLTLRRLQ